MILHTSYGEFKLLKPDELKTLRVVSWSGVENPLEFHKLEVDFAVRRLKATDQLKGLSYLGWARTEEEGQYTTQLYWAAKEDVSATDQLYQWDREFNGTGSFMNIKPHKVYKGAWHEVTHATLQPIDWLEVICHQTAKVDVAIGPPASEQIILADLHYSVDDWKAYQFSIPLVPKGTRIAIRAQSEDKLLDIQLNAVDPKTLRITSMDDASSIIHEPTGITVSADQDISIQALIARLNRLIIGGWL